MKQKWFQRIGLSLLWSFVLVALVYGINALQPPVFKTRVEMGFDAGATGNVYPYQYSDYYTEIARLYTVAEQLKTPSFLELLAARPEISRPIFGEQFVLDKRQVTLLGLTTRVWHLFFGDHQTGFGTGQSMVGIDQSFVINRIAKAIFVEVNGDRQTLGLVVRDPNPAVATAIATVLPTVFQKFLKKNNPDSAVVLQTVTAARKEVGKSLLAFFENFEGTAQAATTSAVGPFLPKGAANQKTAVAILKTKIAGITELLADPVKYVPAYLSDDKQLTELYFKIVEQRLGVQRLQAAALPDQALVSAKQQQLGALLATFNERLKTLRQMYKEAWLALEQNDRENKTKFLAAVDEQGHLEPGIDQIDLNSLFSKQVSWIMPLQVHSVAATFLPGWWYVLAVLSGIMVGLFLSLFFERRTAILFAEMSLSQGLSPSVLGFVAKRMGQ